MATARIRGIYSTALAKLLLNQGFTIVQASQALKERFKLEESGESPDLDINDRGDLQGIRVLGKSEVITTFLSLLSSRLEDVIVRKWSLAAGGIYKGVIKEIDEANNTALIDIGSAVGIIKGPAVPKNSRNLLVQVEGHHPGTKTPVLTGEIKILGKHAILLPSPQVKISRKILDLKTRLRLHQLGEEMTTKGYGVLWRTSAAEQSVDTLREEVNELIEIREEVMKKAENAEAPALILDGASSVDVEFPAQSKHILDDVRKEVVLTIDGHHYYKACGQRISAMLDMAEKMLEKGSSRADVDELFQQTVELEYPITGAWVRIEHVKLSGKVLNLGPALLENYNSETYVLRLHRVFKQEGIYDGLAVRKEPDDYAVTQLRLGDWHSKTQYFSKNDQLKGTYINLNTPIELYPYGIRYVDLEADICLWPDGRFEILDYEKLADALRTGVVTERLVETVKAKLCELVKSIRSDLAS